MVLSSCEKKTMPCWTFLLFWTKAEWTKVVIVGANLGKVLLPFVTSQLFFVFFFLEERSKQGKNDGLFSFLGKCFAFSAHNCSSRHTLAHLKVDSVVWDWCQWSPMALTTPMYESVAEPAWSKHKRAKKSCTLTRAPQRAPHCTFSRKED